MSNLEICRCEEDAVGEDPRCRAHGPVDETRRDITPEGWPRLAKTQAALLSQVEGEQVHLHDALRAILNLWLEVQAGRRSDVAAVFDEAAHIAEQALDAENEVRHG